MERLILEAYDNAKTNDFFVITTTLERLIKRHYACSDPSDDITTGQVRQILDRRGMNYTLDRDNHPRGIAADIGHRVYRKRVRRVSTVLK